MPQDNKVEFFLPNESEKLVEQLSDLIEEASDYIYICCSASASGGGGGLDPNLKLSPSSSRRLGLSLIEKAECGTKVLVLLSPPSKFSGDEAKPAEHRRTDATWSSKSFNQKAKESRL